MRSHTGCQTCRQRKLKCDEQKPVCGHCRKAKRECVPFQGTIFRPHPKSRAAVVDRSRAGSAVHTVNREHDLRSENPSSPPDLQRKFTFIHTVNPSPNRGGSDSNTSSTNQHDNEIPHEGNNEDANIDINIEDSHIGQILNEPIPNHPYIASDQLAVTLPSPVQISPQSQGLVPTPPIHNQVDDSLDVMSIQLLRYFKEIPGRWMDLFDTSAHFTTYTSRLAVTDLLLRNSACAVASKHIYRTVISQSPRRPSAELPHPHFYSDYWRNNLWTRNWSYESVAFYDEALRLLMIEIETLQSNIRSEKVLAAISILCTYELLDASGPGWTAHLSALPLLETAIVQNMHSVSVRQRSLSRPIFWNFARQDYLHAFINETTTRLDWENLPFWRETGLRINENGLLEPNYLSDDIDDDPYSTLSVDEDLISHGLFWLLGRIVNYIVAGDEFIPGDFRRPAEMRSPLGLSQEEILTRWSRLDLEMQTWYNGLPPMFMKYTRTPLNEYQATCYDSTNGLDGYERIWYMSPTCASVIQNYHMARILLLMNKPQQSTALRSSVTERLNSYRKISEQVARHSREICGISMSSPPDSVRIQSVQPLFVAGQCLRGEQERAMVLGMLRGIEHDLGWATDYRVQKLTQEWSKVSP